MEKRPVEDRHDRLRRVDRQRAEPSALAPGQKDRLHSQPSMLSLVPHAHESAELADGHAHLPRAAARGRAADAVRGADDFRRAEGDRRRGDLRARLAHRLGRRLSGAAAQADHPVRAAHRPAGGQAPDPRRRCFRWCRWSCVDAWMATVIIGREFAVTVFRSIAYARGVVDAGVAAREDQDGRARSSPFWR